MLEIIGGSYYEYCYDPQWNELYGSGLRAAVALSQKKVPLRLHTYADTQTSEIIKVIAAHLGIELMCTNSAKAIEFKYQHPLATPTIYPSVAEIIKPSPIKISTDQKILCYGMLEGNALISGCEVVYDPQSPGSPISFWQNGSNAEKLVLVLNYREASTLAHTNDIQDIVSYLFDHEKMYTGIIKNGPEGAIAINHERKTSHIPAYITDRVWTIGSGDIFTSHFAHHYLIQGIELEEAACLASKETAWYANNSTLPIPLSLDDWNPSTIIRKNYQQKKVYLAGPFFTMSDRWLINEFRDALLSMNIMVFSPLHDVGIGTFEEVVAPDLKGLEESDIVLAIVNGLDSGTLFEIGYAKALGKPVIAFSEEDCEKSLTMLYGTNCKILNDFTTTIYHLIWQIYS